METIDHLWTFLCSLDRFMLFLLVGAAAFSITLIVLLWTRWGHSRSLEKCVLLSFLAHALLTGYAATVQIASYRPAPREQFVRIALVDGPPGAQRGDADGTDPAAGLVVAKNPPLSAISGDKDRAAVKKVANPSVSKPLPVVETVAKPQAAVPGVTQNTLRQLAATATASIASGWQMAEAAGKYLQDFGTAHAAELNKVVATLASAPPAPAATQAPTPEAQTATMAVAPNVAGDANMAAEAAMAVGAIAMPGDL